MKWFRSLFGQKRGTKKTQDNLHCQKCGASMPDSKANRRWGICKSCRREQTREQGDYKRIGSGPAAVRVTPCLAWKCPQCGTVLRKGGLGQVFMPGDPVSMVAGTATCSVCNSTYSQSDVYGGRYDFHG